MISPRIKSVSIIITVMAVASVLTTGFVWALNSYLSHETESGTISSQASVVGDNLASGNQAVKFGQGGGAATCANSTPFSPGGPDPWGGCWPGPDNTGVPAGTTLTNYTGPCTITTANITIDSKIIDCNLLVIRAVTLQLQIR